MCAPSPIHTGADASVCGMCVQHAAKALEQTRTEGAQAAREGEEMRGQIEMDAEREVEMQRERCALASQCHATRRLPTACSLHCLAATVLSPPSWLVHAAASDRTAPRLQM